MAIPPHAESREAVLGERMTSTDHHTDEARLAEIAADYGAAGQNPTDEIVFLLSLLEQREAEIASIKDHLAEALENATFGMMALDKMKARAEAAEAQLVALREAAQALYDALHDYIPPFKEDMPPALLQADFALAMALAVQPEEETK